MLSLEQITLLYPPELRPFKRNLLREYLQHKILELIFDSEYGIKLAFMGGTALRILYGNTRFSEDLDFDNFGLREREFEDLAENVRVGLELQGMQVEVDVVGKSAYRCRIRLPQILFLNELTPHQEEKILIQIDSAAHGFDYRPESRILNRVDVFTEIFATPADILLSQKLWAATNRKRAKGRDFFDIVFLLSFTKPNYRYLQLKMGVDNAGSLRSALTKFFRKIDFQELAEDVRPFLFRAEDARKVELFPEIIAQSSLE